MSSYVRYIKEMMKRRWEFFKTDVAAINWTSPTWRKETYAYTTAGFELTWRQGAGIGLGLGTLDLWVGFPRQREMLHYKGCGHLNRFGAPYKNPKPVEA